MNATLKALQDLDTNNDNFDAWADARAVAYEEEADARAMGTSSHHGEWVECSDEECAYYAEMEAREAEEEQHMWEEDEPSFDRAGYYGEMKGYSPCK